MSARTWIMLGAIFGALAVGSGAFGAHGLKARLIESGQLENYETAVRYQMYHSLALVLVGLLALDHASRLLDVAGAAFTAGIFLFSGFLYVMTLGGPKFHWSIVPLGGLAFIVGWIAMAAAAAGLAQK